MQLSSFVIEKLQYAYNACLCIYIVVEMMKFNRNKVLIIMDVELSKQLRLHLLLHGVTLCFTYAVDDDDHQALLMLLLNCTSVQHESCTDWCSHFMLHASAYKITAFFFHYWMSFTPWVWCLVNDIID